jgi:hypothetical protein
VTITRDKLRIYTDLVLASFKATFWAVFKETEQKLKKYSASISFEPVVIRCHYRQSAGLEHYTHTTPFNF